jgi:hypothetical protein
LEKDYFKRFRYLLALERHGSLMHGIQQYELDFTATSSVPAVEFLVHQWSCFMF